jgi:dTDP-4-dehydrorhamnose reductase
MKIFITGANGFLGQHLVTFLANLNYEVIASGRNNSVFTNYPTIQYVNLELTNEQAVNLVLHKYQPHFIIHAAAMSKPNECEVEKEECILNNVTATEYVVKAANTVGAKVIYISTDFVFGEGGPHAETDIPAPLNFYGKSKLLAEQIVQSNSSDSVIMRPVFIYGQLQPSMKPTFLHWVKNILSEGKKIKLVSDQLRTPTYVTDLCKGIAAMIQKNVIGIYHLAGSEIISPFQMAVTVAEVLKLDKNLIENVTSDTFHEPVVRAKKSGLIISKAQLELGYQPIAFTEGVRLSFSDVI